MGQTIFVNVTRILKLLSDYFWGQGDITLRWNTDTPTDIIMIKGEMEIKGR